MTTDLMVKNNADVVILEKVLIQGDLSKLTPKERLFYYNKVCSSLGLNPFTRPFDYITLNGKLTLYAKRDCTDQLRKNHGISIKIITREQIGDLYVVTAQGVNREGRYDESIGAVNIAGLKGDALANAMMKAETKAKRRVTLSLAGLGWLDETEADTVPGAQTVYVDSQGEIVNCAQAEQKIEETDTKTNFQKQAQKPKQPAKDEVAAKVQFYAAQKGYDPAKFGDYVAAVLCEGYEVSSVAQLTEKQWQAIAKAVERLIKKAEERYVQEEIFTEEDGEEEAQEEYAEEGAGE